MKVDQVKLSQQDTNNEEKPIGYRITFKKVNEIKSQSDSTKKINRR